MFGESCINFLSSKRWIILIRGITFRFDWLHMPFSWGALLLQAAGAVGRHHVRLWSRSSGPFPKMPIKDSIKKLQDSFFYVCNVDPRVDCINLRPFVNEPPPAKANWGHTPKNLPQEMLNLCRRITEMTTREGLTRTDLFVAFITRWVMPLQRRAHMIAEMGDRQDPSRLSTQKMSWEQIIEQVDSISMPSLAAGSHFGKAPYD